ncbi:MAG: hypothetical protein Q9208_001078 [Pyrenodesmia sp. 3 TL-2023]
MGDHAPSVSLNGYIETRVDLEPIGQSPVVQIQLPSSGTFSRASRPQRRIVTSIAACQNEEAFTRSCLASAGSIYFSTSRRYPRGFLWRVLDNSKVLELRSVDLTKHGRELREATVILQLVFPSTIRKGCVALADDGKDILSVFVLTKSNELFTSAILTQFFCDVAASEVDMGAWCSTFSPPTLRPCNALRLVAGSPEQLVVTLDDGGILKLNRKAGQGSAGPIWKDLACHEGSGILTSSLRGLIRWQGANSISYDGMVLDPSSAIAAELSPSRSHLVTVCANHTLKIWNLAKGTVIFTMDILGQEREPQDIPGVMLDAGNPEILRVIEADGTIEGDEYYIVTYSPHDGGQFKIWAVRDAEQGSLGIRFLQSDAVLRPPDPDSGLESKAVWKLVDFKLGRGRHDEGIEFWVLMRSSRRYKAYSINFGLSGIHTGWSNTWTSVAAGALNQQPPPQITLSDVRDAPELWLEYLLIPGRFSRTVLETALSAYCSTRKAKGTTNATSSLGERIFSAVCAQVHLQQVKPDEENGTAFAQYREIMQQEWTLFYQEVQDLERLSWQALSLAIDDQSTMPWLLFTGGCAAIRECSRLELMAQNSSAVLQTPTDLLEAPSIEDGPIPEPKLPHELAVLIQAAAGFRESFCIDFKQSCDTWLSSELWQEPLHSVPKRIEEYYERCGFAEEITDSAITGLRESLAPIGDVECLTTDIFLAVIKEMPHFMHTESDLLYSKFGRKVLVKGGQGMIRLHAQILFDLLVLLVFVEIEVDKDMLPKSQLDTSAVFMALVEQLKWYKLMEWLAKTVWSKPSEPPKELDKEATFDSTKEAGLTILETLFAAAMLPQSFRGQSQCASLTGTIQDLLVHTTGGNDEVTLDEAIVHVQCNLLRYNELDLASDFLSFQPSTPWAMYIKGRYHIARRETTEAASCFQKAAYKMGTFLHTHLMDRLTPLHAAGKSTKNYYMAASGVLSSTEAGHFGQGLPFYYEHIYHLFQSASFPSYAAHFAQLALQFTRQSPSIEPPTALLTALFQSSLQTSDIQTAFSALTRLPRHDQTRLLPSLIKNLLAAENGPKQLLDLPWPPHILPAIDAYLANDKPSQLNLSEKPPVSLEQQRKLLAAWRLRHGDFRGAAAALYSQTQQVKQKGTHRTGVVPRFKLPSEGDDLGSRRVDESYLTVINLMACIGDEDSNTNEKRNEAWLLSAVDGGKRRVVTIEDVRKGWQKELDRRSVVEGGRWGFGLGDGEEMELG